MPAVLTAELDRLGGRTRLVDHEYYTAIQNAACPGPGVNGNGDSNNHKVCGGDQHNLQPPEMVWTPESADLLPTIHPTIAHDMHNIDIDFTGFDVGDMSNYSDISSTFLAPTNLPDVQGMSNAFEFNLEQALGSTPGAWPSFLRASGSPAPPASAEQMQSRTSYPASQNGVQQPSPPLVAPTMDATWKVFVEQLGFSD